MLAQAMRVGKLLLVVAAAASACTAVPGSPGTGLKVVTTVTQVSALARAVGGDRIILTALLTSRDDPHSYDLRPDQVSRLAASNVVLLSGAGIDKWMDKGLRAAGVASRATDLSLAVHMRSSAPEGPDPHWWYDTDNAGIAAGRIADAFAQADPSGRSVYEQNARALRARLEAADAEVHAAVDPIPAARRLFVANHDAFNYLLQRYGITLVGDIVPSTDSIAAVRPADVAQLISAVKERHVCAVFTETTVDPKLAQQIAAEAHVKVYDGKLYGDAIGDPGSPGSTLEGAIAEDGKLMAAAFRSC